jgi:transcription antitermination factor NusG
VRQGGPADIETRLAGFLVFAPTIWEPATKIRRNVNGIVRRGLPDRIEPLFCRYFFVRFDRTDFGWTKILRLPGVRPIISSQVGFPIAVPDNVIEAIQGRAHANGCLYPNIPANAARLAKGTRVRPLAGTR